NSTVTNGAANAFAASQPSPTPRAPDSTPAASQAAQSNSSLAATNALMLARELAKAPVLGADDGTNTIIVPFPRSTIPDSTLTNSSTTEVVRSAPGIGPPSGLTDLTQAFTFPPALASDPTRTNLALRSTDYAMNDVQRAPKDQDRTRAAPLRTRPASPAGSSGLTMKSPPHPLGEATGRFSPAAKLITEITPNGYVKRTPSGSLAEKIERKQDGEHHQYFTLTGRVEREVVQKSDGSQQTALYALNGRAVREESIKP